MSPENLYGHRKSLGMHRSELASLLGIGARTLKAYEEGQNPIPRYIALAIGAMLYGLPPAP